MSAKAPLYDCAYAGNRDECAGQAPGRPVGDPIIVDEEPYYYWVCPEGWHQRIVLTKISSPAEGVNSKYVYFCSPLCLVCWKLDNADEWEVCEEDD